MAPISSCRSRPIADAPVSSAVGDRGRAYAWIVRELLDVLRESVSLERVRSSQTDVGADGHIAIGGDGSDRGEQQEGRLEHGATRVRERGGSRARPMRTVDKALGRRRHEADGCECGETSLERTLSALIWRAGRCALKCAAARHAGGQAMEKQLGRADRGQEHGQADHEIQLLNYPGSPRA